jgi:hypothetical protein
MNKEFNREIIEKAEKMEMHDFETVSLQEKFNHAAY